MQFVNIGSLNLDHVYDVAHFVRPGETIHSSVYRLFAGGKGFNQSIALARAGAQVHHIGCTGPDGNWLCRQLLDEGVNVSGILKTETPTGHAMIQVDATGENAIVLFGGANQILTPAHIRSSLANFGKEDVLLIQNETSHAAESISIAAEKGMTVVFNPAPFAPSILEYPLELVDIFILNETEAEGLCGSSDPWVVNERIGSRFPKTKTVLTLGEKGAWYLSGDTAFEQPAFPVQAVDTTAAGDTFTGYFLTSLFTTHNVQQALESGCRAASLCVTKKGAANSIPRAFELL